ncbi:MAG TPA: aa3-type cytochrome c oxidase subunit IV [Caulobacteraceae bacterium]|nr:aa3-type cytochrome c oxidase subunit IV [Caulobacteraceae bacterium]
MAAEASEYHHGQQDISEQQRTFRDAMVATKWSILALAAGITLLTMWFCTAAGFFNGLIAAVIILAVGIFFLRERRSPAH